MTSFASLLKLTRPVNLLIIAATMYSIRWLVMKPLIDRQSLGLSLRLDEGDFFLSCLMMVLLAGAGNIINDYFDQKVDKINKPSKVIVGKYVKRRVAMVLHQCFNILAVLIGVYLAWKTKLWMAVAIPVVLATVLWWYSPLLKKLPLAGNIAVAFCVGLVPLWAGYFEIILLDRSYGDIIPDRITFIRSLWVAVSVFAFFAFLLSLVREAQKDIEDLDGDSQGGFRTLPVVFGINPVKKYILSLLLFCLGLVVWSAWYFYSGKDTRNTVALLAGTLLIIFPLIADIIKTFLSRTKNDFHQASTWSKITMAGGILFTVVIWWMLGKS